MAKKGSAELVRREPERPATLIDKMERRFEELFRRPFPLTGPSWFPRLRFPKTVE